jgi:type VI secretion system ImpC/EvpB family protein
VGVQICRNDLADLLGDDIATLDEALSRQIDAILHHPTFQKLESSWRGLHWLVCQAATADDSPDGRSRIELKVLNVTKRELARDREHAVEFDRSALWRKIYEEEFGTAGGFPFGLLLADYTFGRHPDDVDLLTGLSEVAAAAFAPLLTNPSADLMGIDSLARLNTFNDLRRYQQAPDFVKWRSLRGREESRFVGLPLPRVLGRLPYEGWLAGPEPAACAERAFHRRGFRYREGTDSAAGGRLWMGAIWPLAAVIVQEFGTSGWFADIRGGSRGVDGGGQVQALPVDRFPGLRHSEAVRGPVEVAVTDATQVQLEEAGLIPLCCSGPDGRAVFHTNMSLHQPETFDRPTATANARISAMLQYVMCVSRFAHYLKVIMRNKLGSFAEAAELEQFLNDWVNQYVTPDDRAAAEVRARLPLRAASVQVREEPGSAGAFRVVMHLQPHFQLDQIDATLKLVTTMLRQESR